MATILFGRNRRQNALRVVCPGGEIRISREFGGAVLVKVLAGAGSVEPGEVKEHAAEVRIAFEERGEP